MKNLLFGILFLYSCVSTAQFPEKPIRILTPTPAGTVGDIVGHKLADEMRHHLGQPVLVENKPGAFGVVVGQALLSAPPDGYTIMLAGVSNAASNVTLAKKLPFDPIKDFAPIGYVGEFPFFLVGSPDLSFNTLPQMAAYAKQHPGKLTFAYGANSSQVASAQLASSLGIEVTLVSYLSSAKALIDVMGGRVDLLFSDFSLGLPQARAGKVKGFGVSSRERFALAPDVPTLDETGAPGFELKTWFGLVTASKVPRNAIDRLSAALIASLKSDSLSKSFAAQGLAPKSSSPAEFGEFMKTEVHRWAKMIKDAGIESQ